MDDDKAETARLRAAALKNMQTIRSARQRADRELLAAKQALERETELLQQQRESFEVTLSSIGDAVITTDSAGKVTFLNPVAEALTGWSLGKAQGEPIDRVFCIINEDTRAPAENPVGKVLQTGTGVGLANHTALVGQDGTITPIEDSAAPIRDAHGTITGAVIVFHEVTERRRVERALRTSEERFRAIFQQAAMGIVAADLNTRFVDANERFLELLGYSLEELRALTIIDITHPDDLDDTREHVRRLLAGIIPHYVLERRYVRKNGATVWSRTTVTLLRDANSQVEQLVGIVEDISHRKMTEEALRSTAQRLQLAFTAADIGDWSWDAASDVVTLGTRAAEIFGLPKGVPISRTHMRESLLKDDAERARLAMEQALAQRSDYDMEYRVMPPSGENRWVAVRGRGVYTQTGAVLGMIGVVQDITERRSSEEIRGRLAAVVESSEDAILTKTLEGIITTWNRGAERVFGYTAAEAIGKPVAMLIPPDHLTEEALILERIRQGNRVEHYETVRKKKDGTLLDISLTVSPLTDGGGRVVGASKIARDITPQKRAEAVLGEETRILEVLNATGPAIAAKLDLSELVQTVTDSATQLSGAQFGAFFYNSIDEHGESFTPFALSGASREAFEKFGLPRNTPVFDRTFRGEGIVRSADITQDPLYGTLAPHHGMPAGHLPVRSYLAAPVISRNGEVIGGLFFGHPQTDVFTERAERLIAGVAAQAAVAIDNARLYDAAQREIVKRERAEAALRETDRRKDEFLATLAHELRNPLAPIRQAALISKASTATEAQKRWSHDVISRQVHHMALLLDDLLDVSRITRGSLELRIEMAELAAVVDAAVETARPLLDSKRHALTLDLPGTPVHFAADPLRLAQVLSNLLTNAAKYTDQGGQILLHARCGADSISIGVTDNGIGIPPDALSTIFTMFSQVKSNHDRSEGGLGIGLALSKGLVELHGGTLEARSSGTGNGSELIVRIPRRAIASLPGRTPSHAVGTNNVKRRVLVADDNRDAADSLGMLLRMEGHDVTIVNDGSEALAVFQTVRPEVVILDIGMPELNGYEVARQIRQGSLGRAVTLVAVTGWGQDTDKARALAAGFNYHFTKPVEPERLSELVRSQAGATLP